MAIGEGTRRERDVRSIPAQGASESTRATGKFWTRSVLDALHPDWAVLHQRHWPGRSYDIVDHIAIGPTGIFVVDSVGWSGPVEMTADLLEVNGRSRLSAVQAAQETAREVALLLAPHLREHVNPVMCFSREEAISGWVKGVRVCSTTTLAELLETREAVLSDSEVNRVAGDLDAVLPSAELTSVERSRATDQSIQQPTVVEPTTPAGGAKPRWRRSRIGRITEGLLGMAVVAALGFVGVHITTASVAGDQQPNQGPVHTSKP